MGWESRFNATAVPILGKSFEIVQHWATVIIQCQCEASSILALVGNSGAVAQCDACGNVYGLGKVGATEVGIVRAGLPKEPNSEAVPETVDLDTPQGNA